MKIDGQLLRRARFGPVERRWGHARCLTFPGRTCEQFGDRARAADYHRQALARHPADHLTRNGLARVTATP